MGSHPSFDQVNKINKKELNSAAKSAIETEVAYVEVAKARIGGLECEECQSKGKRMNVYCF